MPKKPDDGRNEPQMVSFSDVARLVVELGYVDNMTRAGVRRISLSHPRWPIREDQLLQIGNAKVMPWPPVKEFFRDIYEAKGRGPDKEPRQSRKKPAAEQ
ncbi:hypothetical protein GCM10010406_21410 [Streptomyces thermolineatus]|uniref:Uncharacterized protein n=1 Tax=Streptomyces thermolineatus TaxID=44033 RepID=A0ABP5YPN6_9ACTN